MERSLRGCPRAHPAQPPLSCQIDDFGEFWNFLESVPDLSGTVENCEKLFPKRLKRPENGFPELSNGGKHITQLVRVAEGDPLE